MDNSTSTNPNDAQQVVASQVETSPVEAVKPEPASTDTQALPVVSSEAVLQRLIKDMLAEKRAARRWKYGFRFFLIALLLVLLFIPFGFFNLRGTKSTKALDEPAHVAVVSVKGAIEAEGPTSADALNSAINAAFEDGNSLGVVLRLNSPGGSPVQSAMVYDEIRRMRELFPKKKIIAVVEEICASGCYYIASAADEIYVNHSSLVGSIGVIMEGFGATELMKKLGVERRVITAGENKNLSDPFSAQSKAQKQYFESLLAQVHEQFIKAVKDGRGKRLKGDEKMFSGLIYTGQGSIENGLTDGLHSVASSAREIFKSEHLVDYTPQENIAEKVAKRLGAQFGASFFNGFKSSAEGKLQ